MGIKKGMGCQPLLGTLPVVPGYLFIVLLSKAAGKYQAFPFFRHDLQYSYPPSHFA
jgi:hypothetical protein